MPPTPEDRYYRDGETTADGRAWKQTKLIKFQEVKLLFDEYMGGCSRVWIYKVAEKYDFGFKDEHGHWWFQEKRAIRYLQGKMKPLKAGRPKKRGVKKQWYKHVPKPAKPGDRVKYIADDGSKFVGLKGTLIYNHKGYLVNFDKKICAIKDWYEDAGRPGHSAVFTRDEIKKNFKVTERRNEKWKKQKQEEKRLRKEEEERIRQEILETLRKREENKADSSQDTP